MEGKVLQTTKEVFVDGVQVNLAMSRRGDLFVADWKDAAKMEGRGFITSIGTLSTPALGGGAGTVVDLDQPEFGMLIPSGITVIPLRMAAQLTVPLLATDADESEALAIIDVTAATVAAALDGTWTTTHTPKNMKIALAAQSIVSVCTVKSLCTADTTDPTEGHHLCHALITGDVNGTPANALWTKNQLLYEPLHPPFIVGPACIFAYWGGTVATSAFFQFSWLEIPSGQLV
jgi:hypothetical protein